MPRHPGDATAKLNLPKGVHGMKDPAVRAKARAARKANEVAKRDGAEIARRLTSGDKVYMANLRKRLRAGTAGPIENLLWMLAHGKPKEQTAGEDVQARITEVRKAAKKAIQEAKPRFALTSGVVDAEVVEPGNGRS
jgi:hypothetical protein